MQADLSLFEAVANGSGQNLGGSMSVFNAIDVDSDPQVQQVEQGIRELAKEWNEIRHYLDEAESMKSGFESSFASVMKQFRQLEKRKHQMMKQEEADFQKRIQAGETQEQIWGEWEAAGEPQSDSEALDEKVSELEKQLENYGDVWEHLSAD